jgi:hypothetical protein
VTLRSRDAGSYRGQDLSRQVHLESKLKLASRLSEAKKERRPEAQLTGAERMRSWLVEVVFATPGLVKPCGVTT